MNIVFSSPNPYVHPCTNSQNFWSPNSSPFRGPKKKPCEVARSTIWPENDQRNLHKKNPKPYSYFEQGISHGGGFDRDFDKTTSPASVMPDATRDFLDKLRYPKTPTPGTVNDGTTRRWWVQLPQGLMSPNLRANKNTWKNGFFGKTPNF